MKVLSSLQFAQNLFCHPFGDWYVRNIQPLENFEGVETREIHMYVSTHCRNCSQVNFGGTNCEHDCESIVDACIHVNDYGLGQDPRISKLSVRGKGVVTWA